MSSKQNPSPYQKEAPVISTHSLDPLANSTTLRNMPNTQGITQSQQHRLQETSSHTTDTTTTHISSEDGARELEITRVKTGSHTSYTVQLVRKGGNGSLQIDAVENSYIDTSSADKENPLSEKTAPDPSEIKLDNKVMSAEEVAGILGDSNHLYRTSFNGQHAALEGVRDGDPDTADMYTMPEHNAPTLTSEQTSGVFRKTIDEILEKNMTGKQAQALENAVLLMKEYEADGYTPQEISQINAQFNNVKKAAISRE